MQTRLKFASSKLARAPRLSVTFESMTAYMMLTQTGLNKLGLGTCYGIMMLLFHESWKMVFFFDNTMQDQYTRLS